MNDAELLHRYASHRDEAAFAEFVRRHIDAVYSVALRGAGHDAHLAQDIAQQVFLAASRDAGRLAAHPVLTAWLYTATRYATATAVRGERRRKSREQHAPTMEDTDATAPLADWPEVAAVLDGALDTLGEKERAAVLLRFMDRRSFAEIGAALGVAEDAARKRVDRALDKLRLALRKRGVASSAAALGGALAQNAIVAAPAGLAANVTGAVLAQGGAVTGAIAFMTMLKISGGVAATALIGAVAWQQFQGGEAHAASMSPVTGSTTSATAPGSPPKSPAQAAVVAPVPGPSAATGAAATRAPAMPAAKQNAVETRVGRLNTLVGLTPEQQARVAGIFRKEASALEAFPAGEQRAIQGMETRQAARAEVRALLTPEQRKKYDVSPQTLGGGMRTNPEALMQRLDETVALSADQKRMVTAIFLDDIIDQMAALPPEEELPGFRWRDKVRTQLRAVLTAEQQAKFDATVPYRASGRSGGAR